MNNQSPFSIALAASLIGGLLAALAVLLLTGYQPHVENGTVRLETERIVTQDVSRIVQDANPAVVSIVVAQEVPIIERYYEDLQAPDGSTLPFSIRVPQLRQNGTQLQTVGEGSGFFISPDGYVVTNAHVVNTPSGQFQVVTTDDRLFDAELIAQDNELDIALLKIEITDAPHLRFGDSDQLALGQSVIVIGNALAEFSNSVSTGVVSGLSRSIVAGDGTGNSEVLENVIQTDAAINPGNSGGPLLNVNGDVVGMNVAVARGSENIGFAIPANLVQAAVESMQQHGRVIRPYMGVRYVTVTGRVQDELSLPIAYGALISEETDGDSASVLENSPAAQAGLEPGDLLTAINGQRIDQAHTLASLIQSYNVGETITVTFLRDAQEQEVQLTLQEMPAQ